MTVFGSQQLPSEHESTQNMAITNTNFSLHSMRVESGLEFILKHLSGPQFPRKISTALLENRQKEVGYKDLAMLYYQGALWENCRIAAFYPGQKNPDLIFIDIDRKHFKSDRALKAALTKVLKHISKKIGGHPTVLWSGRGFHLILPIDCSEDLDNVKEFGALVRDKDVNKAFLQFASRYLSKNKHDKDNYTSLKSCLLRIPGSYNAKCKEEGIDPEVKIIQEWDGYRPDVRLLLGSFYSYLVGKKKKKFHPIGTRGPYISVGSTPWIERLLQTPIEDYRKHACDLILIPYLVVRKGMTDPDEIIDTIMQWADRCHELSSLDPSYREFVKRVESRVEQVMQDGIPPMKWETLQQENPELAQKLRMSRMD